MDLRIWGGGGVRCDRVREWYGHIYTTKKKKNWEELTIYPIFAAFWYNQIVVRGKFFFVEEFQVINARKTY